MNELGNLLRNLRGKESLRSVGERTGLSHSYISDIENGYRRGTKKPIHPSADTLQRLAKAYKYPVNRLLQVAGYMEMENEDLKPESENESLFFFDKEDITPEEMEELKKYLEFMRMKAKQENEKKD
ncbi:transcriptional regulator [Sutcliffiella horikoshii]|uniref:helix-turn-helix domain-containing protein n=1 Tax=Sutcliffiella horikoshii TaxID=79883 RepID=UPI001CC04BF5|nr:helix-turn-helix transcriptional regulator [Sutcliffiella horikoshii]UAL46837.1 transcriptional regulator [Sutcliffiella horikoshii]